MDWSQLFLSYRYHISRHEAVIMPWWQFEQHMLTVLPLIAQTSTDHYLVPASEEMRAVDLLIYLLYAAATQI